MARRRTISFPRVDSWIQEIETASKEFASRFGATYSLVDRELSGIFEIGCFLSIVADYERQNVVVEAKNIKPEGFRYLTTPNGNPNNFSYVKLVLAEQAWELRQQVRICSHLHPDINFTPDMAVVVEGAEIRSERDQDFASGRRSFYRVNASDVIAAHECKSMTGFPELYVSFIGMFLVAHEWFTGTKSREVQETTSGHLAPSLFVGSEVSNLHRRMIAGLETKFPINLITGVYRGPVLRYRENEVHRLPFSAKTPMS